MQKYDNFVIRSPKTKDMFKHKTKEHKMKLRKDNKYQVQKINAVSMQKSAIPQMTKYLNIKNKQRTAHQRNKGNYSQIFSLIPSLCTSEL